MDDKTIISLFNQRNEDAIIATDKQYGHYCRSIALRILQNKNDAEECVNEAYMHIWEAIPPASPKNFRLFLGKIVRHIAIHIHEKQSAVKRGGGQYNLALNELLECLPTHETPETITDSIVIQDVLNRFLDTLTVNEKFIFLKRYWYLDSVSDIAKKAHTSQNNVYVILHRTRQKLRKLLEEEGIVI